MQSSHDPDEGIILLEHVPPIESEGSRLPPNRKLTRSSIIPPLPTQALDKERRNGEPKTKHEYTFPTK
jgi:hypothetical protein